MTKQYKLEKVFPLGRDSCGIGACPAIYGGHDEEGREYYVVVGRQLSKSEIEQHGLTDKVANSEVAVCVDSDSNSAR